MSENKEIKTGITDIDLILSGGLKSTELCSICSPPTNKSGYLQIYMERAVRPVKACGIEVIETNTDPI